MGAEIVDTENARLVQELVVQFLRDSEKLNDLVTHAVIELIAERLVFADGFIQGHFFHAHHRNEHRAQTHRFRVICNRPAPIIEGINIDAPHCKSISID